MAKTKTAPKITKFTKNNLDSVTKPIIDVLNASPELKALGVTFNYRGCNYADVSFTMKLEVALRKEDGSARDVELEKDRQHFIDMAKPYDLNPEWIDKTFQHSSGVTLRIAGLASRGKFPVICIGDDGKKFMLPIDSIQIYMSEDRDAATAAVLAKIEQERRRDWKLNYMGKCFELGLKLDWIDKTFSARGRTAKLVGLETKKKYQNFPIVGEKKDGTLAMFSLKEVQTALQVAA